MSNPIVFYIFRPSFLCTDICYQLIFQHFILIIIVINFYKLNGRVKFYFSVIYRQKTLESPRELFLDPNQFSNDGSMSIGQTQFSKDGSIMAYTVSEKGSDSSAIRVN